MSSGCWSIAIARYNVRIDQVAERRLKDNLDWKEAEAYIIKNQDKPIYAYAQNCVDFDNPELGMIKTDAYKKEYLKIIDG
jgi:hypothetical protein